MVLANYNGRRLTVESGDLLWVRLSRKIRLDLLLYLLHVDFVSQLSRGVTFALQISLRSPSFCG